MDNGDVSLLTPLDLSAAFDIIDHNILLQRLEHLYGISGTPLNWSRSYLPNRTQTVIINNRLSQLSMLNFGVPQGSVLGPILFIMYKKKLLLHSFDSTPSSTSLMQTTLSCTILAVLIK